MIYVAQIAADNSCITFDKKSSMYARYGKNAVKVETLPDGAGTLRCDGEAVWRDEIPLPDLADLKEQKLQEISETCRATVITGFTATLSDGTQGHFSLTEEDQINITTAVAAVQQGAEGYPYHADGQLCTIFPAQDIVIIGTTAAGHKIYHTTYFNHLKIWTTRAETAEELDSIYYGAALPEDLQKNLEEVLHHAGLV